ncbi:tributyrin esterase [Stieleria marina]|uniref:GXGXG motif protein n=1 Tax=Stieleria marina TaxID=1930275 RepID=A0A517P2N0_9BACT|nr:GXGXG motif protein [Planctomycetes bacterium K23_9]
MSPPKPTSKPNAAGADSTGVDALSPSAHEISMAGLSRDQVRAAIHEITPSDNDEELTQIKLTGAEGQHSALMRIDHPVRLQIEGALGDYAFAFNAQADSRLVGNVGNGVGEGMMSGAVRIRGNAADGAGAAMTGGTLAIYGSAGDRCGAGMRGGGIFVRGNAGNEIAVGALGGMIVIGGDAGERLGDAMSNVTIFIRGRAKSLAEGVTDAPLRKREELRLGLLLINASIRGDAQEFRRIIPASVLDQENSRRGEVNPSYR